MSYKIPTYEAKIMGADNTGVYALSFVETPANESLFIALSKAAPVKLSKDRQKQILTGAVLIPDQLIYRFDERLGEYYLKFTAEDIEKISHKMMRTGLALQSTTHQHEKPLKGNYLTELWIVKDPKRDKAVALGLGELPAGTLVASYKITDATYWASEVMAGKVKGFSIEGIFNFNNVNMKKTTIKPGAKPPAKKVGAMSAFFKAFTALLEGETAAEADDLADEAKKDEVDAGVPVLIFDLAEGGEIHVDSEGFATLDGEQMAAGEHALADGNFIVIDDAGLLVITQPEADGAEAAEAATELARENAKAFLAKMKPSKDAKIKALETELAALKKQPSTKKVQPKAEGVTLSKDASFTEKMAAVIKLRRERKDGK